MKGIVIAIDGPAGSGKSTVAKIIAKKLKLLYIDTGAMYRAVTLGTVEKGIAPSDVPAVIDFARRARIDLENAPGESLRVKLNGADVSEEIRSQKVNSRVSDIAKIKEVRQVMVKEQRRLGENGNVVLEGRDIGTVVFPDADFKFFLDASVDERAKRRYEEIKEKENLSFKEVKQNVEARDKIDSSRDVGPLKKAQDAIPIDTTNMTIVEVVETLLKEINERN